MEWASYLAKGVPPAKRMLIGGNWKCNGTVKEMEKIISTINSAGPFPLASEVGGELTRGNLILIDRCK